jgi:hypothetical protein
MCHSRYFSISHCPISQMKLKLERLFFRSASDAQPQWEGIIVAPMSIWIKGLPRIGEVSMELNEW